MDHGWAEVKEIWMSATSFYMAYIHVKLLLIAIRNIPAAHVLIKWSTGKA